MHPRSGQTSTEAILLIPVFLLLVFAIVQIAHIGVGVVVMQYAASSIARQAVQSGDPNDEAKAKEKLGHLMFAGLTAGKVHTGLKTETTANEVTPTVEVVTCAELTAYPFVGEFLSKASWKTANATTECLGSSLTPVMLKGPAPYKFLIRGQSLARMNYQPRG